MKAVTNFVAVLFGPSRRAGHMTAPGDADCRWRVAVALGRVSAVNDDVASPDARLPEPGDPSDYKSNASDPW